MITIYSTPTCPYCIQAKEYFKENNIKFTDYNVAEDQEKAQEMQEKSGQLGVPVIVIGDEVLVGFNKNELDEKLKEAGLL